MRLSGSTDRVPVGTATPAFMRSLRRFSWLVRASAPWPLCNASLSKRLTPRIWPTLCGSARGAPKASAQNLSRHKSTSNRAPSAGGLDCGRTIRQLVRFEYGVLQLNAHITLALVFKVVADTGLPLLQLWDRAVVCCFGDTNRLLRPRTRK